MSKRPAEELASGGPIRVARENGQEDARTAIRRVGARETSRYPTTNYRETEPLNAIIQHWQARNGEEVSLEVIIPSEYLSKDNKRVRSRQMWGDLVYTHDSDIVAVLMHMGYFTSILPSAPQAVTEARAVIKLVPSPNLYPSKHRFVKSRAWNRPSDICAYKVEQFWLITRSGRIVEMQPCVDDLPAPQPTVQPQASDRHMTTRTTGSKGRMAQDVTLQFNLCNEPWLKYTLAAVADKGLKSSQLTSARLIDHVLFLETASHRYQIARAGTEDGAKELYTLSQCKMPMPASVMQRVGLPLPPSDVNLIESGLDWEEISWGVSMLHVRGREYVLRRIHMMRAVKPGAPPTS